MSRVASVPDDALDPIERLALVYAERRARPAWQALLLFRHRLEDAARSGREPLMIQLRLSWWRDRLSEPSARWPKGEPLLAQLAVWEAETDALIALVDGWEAKVVGEDGGIALGAAQISAFEALGRLVGEKDAQAIRTTGARLLGLKQAPLPKLSRSMRPLSVLAAYACQAEPGGSERPVARFAALLRIGLLGR